MDTVQERHTGKDSGIGGLMLSRVLRWIDERWPLTPFMRLALEEDMSGGSSYAYVFGSAALIVFLLQVATGIWQLFCYVPTLSQGYNSLNYLRTEVPFGWLIHGLHYWGANAMVVLVMLHMSQVFIWGAYKKPHELQWVTGVFLFLLAMAMSLTGGALPWDKRSYWLVEVASSSAGTVPIIGEFIKRMMLGGGVIGQLTLSRFFILHAAILAGILLIVVAIHLVALRKVGNAGPWDEKMREKKGPFWPDQVFKDGLVASLIILLLVGLCVYVPPPFSGMADPLDASYIPKPEWNFLFFYEVLKFFPGRLEVIATIGIPVIGTLVILLIPFVDSDVERRPAKRPIFMVGWLMVVVFFIAFTLAGAYGKSEGVVSAGPTASPPAAAPTAPPTASKTAGADLFKAKGCIACHRINRTGGSIGPDLSGEGLKGHSREWLTEQLMNPKSHDPATVMPSFATIGKSEINNLVNYLLSLKAKTASGAAASTAAAPAVQAPAAAVGPGPRGQTGQAVTIIGSGEHGAVLFDANCTSCHGPNGTDKVPNQGSKDGTVPPLNPIDPDLFSHDPKTFAGKIDIYIQHGSRPEGPSPQLSMIPFGDTNALTQQQIADIEAYILSLNGVDRAAINHPGLTPDTFFIVTVFAFLLVGINLGGWWLWGLGKEQTKEVDK